MKKLLSLSGFFVGTGARQRILGGWSLSSLPSQLRLLLLLPFAPRLDAAHGGGRVLSWFLAEAVKHHRVAVLCLREPGEPNVDDFFRQHCELVEEVARTSARNSFSGRMMRGAQILSCLAQLRPLWVSDWSSAPFQERVRTVARDFQPHIVQAEFHVMGQYLPYSGDSSAARVLVEHEPGTRAAPYLRTLPPVLAGAVNRVEGLSWRRYEAAIYEQVDGIVVFTEPDRGAVRELARETPIRIIPPAVAIPERPLDPVGRLPLNLVFVGNFIHPPNVDAAVWLVQAIFPAVQAHFPDAELFIVGEQPPAELKALAGGSVMITGRVQDVTPYLDQASIFVAPMRLGGGIRIKVLDALAAGKAVVATPLAVEGLDLVDGRQVSLAGSGTELVERINYLLSDPRERLSLGRGARAWACEHLGMEHPIAGYEAFYAELLGGSRQRREPRE